MLNIVETNAMIKYCFEQAQGLESTRPGKEKKKKVFF